MKSWVLVASCLIVAGAASSEVMKLSDHEDAAAKRLLQLVVAQMKYSNGGWDSYAASFQELETGKPSEDAPKSDSKDGYVFTLTATEFSCPGKDQDKRECKVGKDNACTVHNQPGQFWDWHAEAHPAEYPKTGRLSFFVDHWGVVRAQDLQGAPGNAEMPELETGTVEDYEAKATRALRALSAAQTNYNFNSKSHSFASTLQELHTGEGPGEAAYIGERLASGRYYGYIVTLSVGGFECAERHDEQGNPVPGPECEPDATAVCKSHGKPGRFSSWSAEAHPAEYGKTGKRSFYIDESGIIRGADVGGKAGTVDLPEL